MGIFDRVIDTEATHTFTIDDTEITAKRADAEDARRFVDEHANPELKDEAMRADRKTLLNKFFAEEVIVSIKDDDFEDTEGNRVMLMNYPQFSPDAERIRNEAYTDSNFKMERDEALKKFSPTTSEESDIGSESIAATG